MVWKIWSVVALGPPVQLHEQLTWRAALSLAMRLSTSLGLKLLGLPSYTITFASPGAMLIVISISSETSSCPPFPEGVPEKLSSVTFDSGTLGNPTCAS